MSIFSILDLAPVPEGSTVGQALRNSIDLAQWAEQLGYHRYWVAEHHNMPGVASAATAVLLGQIAAATRSLRLGAGGIMLPNHAPLIVAEQFGTLAALYPGRIELGLGRAPGTDGHTAHALRRNLHSSAEQFPQDVQELLGYFHDSELRAPVRAIPGAGEQVPVWILGSSLFGAQLAAKLGLPFAFASHFAPAQLLDALRIYRQQFIPSPQLEAPYTMAGFNIYAADTDEEAHLLASSMQQGFIRLRRGMPGTLAPPIANYLESLSPPEQQLLQGIMRCSAIGAPETVAAQTQAFVEESGVDEVMIACQIHDHQARRRSLEIAASVLL
ncbi:LLM class flavin-dependent oxidoreductase [Spongiibacter tropicus]|uniref:LLM class flavin-dependent oxidoreductase n=1 Tax=Spongiibacter tropicus TaxID=454602 RepID=UPI0035BE7605